MRKTIVLAIVAIACALGATAQTKSDIINEIAKRFTFSGYAQLGWEYHSELDPNNDFTINKLILMSHVKVTEKISAFTMFDFKGGTLHELWVNYNPKPWLNVKVGQFKTPYTFENPISPAILETISQLSLAGSWMICGSDPMMMPGGAGRDIGINVYGDLPKGIASYDLAVMNGAGRNRRDDNSWKDVVARLTFHPLAGLDVGGSMIIGQGKCHSDYWVSGAHSDGRFSRNRFAASAQLKTKPVNARAEYMWGNNGDNDSNGGYITVQVNNVVKNLDIVASFDHLEGDVPQEVNRLQAGLQYWFYPKCRIQAAYSYTDREFGDPDHAILTQIQVAF